MKRTTKSIQAEIAKGAFRPHTALSTMALAYYQQETTSFAKNMFPVCPVQLSSDNYYVFDKEDLLRDNWNRKPAYGSVDPAVISEHTENYACHVDQMMMGIDNIRQTDLNRRQGPHTKDPRQQRTKVIATQANIHQDAEFSKSFMRKGVWKNEASAIRATVKGQVAKINRQVVARGVRAVNAMRNAELEVLKGQRSGRTYRKPHSKATYTASAPGEPPARRTGNLRMHWNGQVKSEGSTAGGGVQIIAELESQEKYAGYLENGTKKMAARPFADKIKEKATPEIEKIYKEPYG